MFKGLRTKIESEQKGQGSIKSTRVAQNDAKSSESILKDQGNSTSKITFTSLDDQANLVQKINELSLPQSKYHDSSQKNERELQFESVEDLKCQISKLNDQLQAVIKEKDESNDQNAQLYQIIEKLRRNLENEKEINSSLQIKLNEVESELKEKSNLKSNNRTTSISINSFSPDGLSSAGLNTSDDIGVLRHEIIELRAQLSKKNRQLKIRQQNLSDIKRALQKEMLDHSRTQDELNKLQNQLKERELHIQADKIDIVQENGSNQSETSDMNTRNQYFKQNVSDKNQESNLHVGNGGGSGTGEDAISLNAGVCTAQLDRISCLSRSSASVDDFDSNDLQQNSYNREVSHEYLRNVLFRYMTSTDTETTQHLIKAISIIMNFTPEQSAAIKSAMHSRTSWLRLK